MSKLLITSDEPVIGFTCADEEQPAQAGEVIYLPFQVQAVEQMKDAEHHVWRVALTMDGEPFKANGHTLYLQVDAQASMTVVLPTHQLQGVSQ